MVVSPQKPPASAPASIAREAIKPQPESMVPSKPTPSPVIQIQVKKMAWGDKGARRSIQEVARLAKENRNCPYVRAWVTQKLWEAMQKGLDVDDPMVRAQVLLEAVQREIVYVNDPAGSEMITAPKWLIQKIIPGGDCFAEGTLLLTEGHRLVPIERVEVGTRIWGLNGWTKVEKFFAKGTLPIDVVCLNNGSQLKLTSDHNMNVMVCPKHSTGEGRATVKHRCGCPMDERVMKTLKVSELEPGMVLPSPDRIPFGSGEELSPERAYVEGLYLSDGWAEDKRFSISGKDGCPKEEQKREVQAICERLGIRTTWHERHLRVNDPVWTRRLQQMGEHAPDKHLLSVNLDEGQAAETLRGIMADSGKNTHGSGRTLTTTSRQLAVQTRVLFKMFGVSCGWSFLEDHGGLGKNPIWRLNTRGKETKDGRAPKMLRVRSVEKSVAEVPCYDIQTGDHMVYLPEHDVTVHNCDDKTFLMTTALLVALLSSGMRVAVIGHSYTDDHNLGHILAAVHYKNRWYYADGCTTQPLGPPIATPTWELVYDPLEPDEPLCDATACLARPGFKPARITWSHADMVGVSGLPSFDTEEPVPMFVIEPESSASVQAVSVAVPPPARWGIPTVTGAKAKATSSKPAATWGAPSLPRKRVASVIQTFEQVFQPPQEPEAAPAQVRDAWPAWKNWLTSLRDALQIDAYDLNDKYEAMRQVCTDFQIPFPPTVPGATWDSNTAWLYTNLTQFATDAVTFLTDAIEGRRDVLRVAPGSDMDLPSASQAQNLGIASLPSDAIRYTYGEKSLAIPIPQPISSNYETAQPPSPVPTVPQGEAAQAGVGFVQFLLPVVASGAVALTTGMIFHGRALIAAIKETIENITTILLMREMGNLSDKGWTPEQVKGALGKINQGIVDRKDAEIRRLQEEAKIIQAETEQAKTVLNRVLWIGGLALVGVGGWYAWNEFGKPYMAARKAKELDSGPATESHRGPASAPSPRTETHRGPAPEPIHGATTEPLSPSEMRQRYGAKTPESGVRKVTDAEPDTARTPMFFGSDSPTQRSPVYQGNPRKGQRSANPIADPNTLLDQLVKHEQWGEYAEAKELVEKAFQSWNSSFNFDNSYVFSEYVDWLIRSILLQKTPLSLGLLYAIRGEIKYRLHDESKEILEIIALFDRYIERRRQHGVAA